jgi:hypothetical protein
MATWIQFEFLNTYRCCTIEVIGAKNTEDSIGQKLKL